MSTEAELLRFAGALAPELLALYQRTKGDAKEARARMHEILDRVEQAENEIDRDLERQAAAEKKK